MIRDDIMQIAASDPQYQKAVDAMEAQLARNPIVPEDMDEAIALLEFVLQNPDKYQEVLAAAISDGIIDPGMFPEQYDQVFIVSLLVALYGLQDRLNQRGFARGGLSVAARKLQTGGQGGDTELVHVNRREAEMLRRMGGSGDVNPHTGLHEYKSFKKILGAVLPIAVNLIPGVGQAISGALLATGIGATAAAVGTGALVGAASSALSGGNVLKGAVMGGLGSGLGSAVGGTANSALGLNLGQAGQNVLGSALVGGAMGQASGQGFLKGAAQGAAGGALGQLAAGVNAPNAFQQGVQAGGQSFGNAITAGYDPKTAATVGLASGLSRGLTYKAPAATPSDTVVDGLKGMPTTETSGFKFNPETGKMEWSMTGMPSPEMATMPSGNMVNQSAIDKLVTPTVAAPQVATPAPTTPAAAGSGIGGLGKYVALAGTLGSLLSSAPKEVQEAVTTLSPEQQEYFNRPSVAWDWNKMQQDAAASNMSLGQYMARNWNAVTGGQYNSAPTGMAHGGALSAVARFAKGAGSGRDDVIDAKLSDGEYVMDAETVALIGDGSSKEGAARLDSMRKKLREHKGKALAKGKFSPNAKSPLAYLKGAA